MVRMRDCEVVEATHEPSSPPVQPFVAYATKGCRRRFLASMRDFEIVGATHEPQKVAQASCLFGADRLEACPTLQPAPRFMAPTHVRTLEVFPFHEPPPRSGVSAERRNSWEQQPAALCRDAATPGFMDPTSTGLYLNPKLKIALALLAVVMLLAAARFANLQAQSR